MPDSQALVADLQVRFWAKVDRCHETGCWPWTGAVSHGYGIFKVAGKVIKSHRFAYELLVGPIPDGKELDHRCHDPQACPGGFSCPHRACVNPAHLVPVSHRQNTLRGAGPTAINAALHLARCGHPFDYIEAYGGRRCYSCHLEKARQRYRERRRAA